eukprot:7391608-Prymnesium_polylepis.2
MSGPLGSRASALAATRRTDTARACLTHIRSVDRDRVRRLVAAPLLSVVVAASAQVREPDEERAELREAVPPKPNAVC